MQPGSLLYWNWSPDANTVPLHDASLNVAPSERNQTPRHLDLSSLLRTVRGLR